MNSSLTLQKKLYEQGYDELNEEEQFHLNEMGIVQNYPKVKVETPTNSFVRQTLRTPLAKEDRLSILKSLEERQSSLVDQILKKVSPNHPLNASYNPIIEGGYNKIFEYKPEQNLVKKELSVVSEKENDFKSKEAQILPKPMSKMEGDDQQEAANKLDAEFGLYIDLNKKSYEQKSFQQIIDDGYRVTKNKIQTDINFENENQQEKYKDLLSFYKAENENEVAILMTVPTIEEQMQLCRAYDLNPLIQLEMQHSYTSCHTSSFVNPRQNKDLKSRNDQIVYESQFFNLTYRDEEKIDKLRIVKVIHAFIHKRVFIFVTKQIMYERISSLLISAFDFQPIKQSMIETEQKTYSKPPESEDIKRSSVNSSVNERDEDFDSMDEDLPDAREEEKKNGNSGKFDTELFINQCEALVCTDVIFAVLNDTFNKTEPIVHGFKREAILLNNTIDQKKPNQRIEVISSICLAKETALDLVQEIDNKLDLLEQMQILTYNSGVNFHESAIKIRFLMCRLRVQSNMMQMSFQMIDLALDKFGQYIDNDIQTYNKDLNKVMKVFTFIAVSFLPQTVLGSLFGMNVKVPYQTGDENLSIVPWLVVVSTSIFFTFISFCVFKYLRYI